MEKSSLSSAEKELLLRVNVQGETITAVAGDPKKKGGKSSQHKRALEHFAEWLQQELRATSAQLAKLQATSPSVEEMKDRVTALEKLVGLGGSYMPYLGRLMLVADAIGPSRSKTCLHATLGPDCEVMSVRPDHMICGICGNYAARHEEESLK